MTPESSVPPEHNATGRSIAGSNPPQPAIPDYELLRLIGQGGYGEVWLARSLTGLYRAIKVVRRDRFADDAPFEREFQGLSRFAASAQPGQLALLHVGRNEAAGFFYYVMELADDADRGREIDPSRYRPLTLREVRIRRGRLPAGECLGYAIALGEDLAALHQRGLVHRDIKPSNVILIGGRPKLADIGLVAEAAEALTYVGTEGYVPPEGPGKPAADVFALGNLLYEIATGLDRADFPRLPSDLDSFPDRRGLVALNAVILRAADRDPATRFPDAGALLAELRRLDRKRSAHWPWWIAAGLAVALVTSWRLGAWRSAPPAGPTAAASATPAAPARKSIAVLPFENLNEDQQDAFFANGVHEEILTDLGNIAALRVISRTTVMHYRGTTKTMAEIGRELGVEYILEGSVRRVGQQIRVSGQLIRAAADEHLWAHAYDGDAGDVLALQARLATAIAQQLQTVLTPEEAKRLSTLAVADPRAHDLYLRGRDLMRRQQDGMDVDPHIEALFRQATELDPKFALPWVELARTHVRRYFNDRSQTAARDLAKVEIDRAMALAPDRAEVQAGLGEYYYFGSADYTAAAEHYQNALALEPSNAEVHSLLGLLARRLKHWRQALVELKAAHDLDPLNVPTANFLKSTLGWTRNYAAARDLALAMSATEPANLKLRAEAAFYECNRLLSRQPFDEFYAGLSPAERATPAGRELKLWILFDSGDAAGYLKEAESLQPADPDDDDAILHLAMVRRILGRDYLPALAEQRMRIEERVAANPRESAEWMVLARICSLQGERARAEFALGRAAALSPESSDPLTWQSESVERITVLAWLGDPEAAIDLFARFVRLPGPMLHPFRIRTGLDFWPLRDNPRFKKILADPKTYEVEL